MVIVTDLYSSIEGVREIEKMSKIGGYYATYSMGTVFSKWANRDKVLEILTVDYIRE